MVHIANENLPGRISDVWDDLDLIGLKLINALSASNMQMILESLVQQKKHAPTI